MIMSWNQVIGRGKGLATRPLSARISSSTPFTLQRLTSDVSLRMMLVNDEIFNVDVKIEVKYKRIETGIEYTYRCYCTGVVSWLTNYIYSANNWLVDWIKYI